MAAKPDFEPVDVTLRDGRSVHLRALQGTDADELLQAFGRLSAQTRYLRFMHAVATLDPAQLRQSIAQLLERGLAIVATVPADDGIDIVGGASFIVSTEPEVCEFAITVVDAWEGVGLGGQLMRRLIEAARRRGLRRMEGYVLATNQPMLRLARSLGFDSRPDHEDFSVRIVRLELQR
jgi:RimJ/RimL family protein N-acetyltransferase